MAAPSPADSLASARKQSVEEWEQTRARKAYASRTLLDPLSLFAPLPADGTMPPGKLGGFAVGTFLLDACASMWFSYLLLFLDRVQGLSGVEAGIVLLTGQLADAISTPFLGFLSDKSSGIKALGLGRRPAFFALGTAIVVSSFFFVFGLCLPCVVQGEGVSSTAVTAYYAAVAGLFNIGWSACQVSHMALVPEITALDEARLALNSARYACSVFANLFVYTTAFVLLQAAPSREEGEDNPATYSSLAIWVLGVGGFFSLLFLAVSRTLGGQGGAQAGGSGPGAAMGVGKSPAEWLRTSDFYKTAFMYTMMRLGISIQAVYLAFYITVVVRMDQTSIAMLPLVIFASSLASALLLKRLSTRFGRLQTLTGGGVLYVMGCIATAVMPASLSGLMYPVAVCLGAGAAAITISVHTLQSDLIGLEVASGAFVFGAMSFADKLTTGVVVVMLQAISDGVPAGGEVDFFRYVESIAPLLAIFLCVLTAWTIRGRKGASGGREGVTSLVVVANVVASGARQLPPGSYLEGEGGR
jgi:Na+/melibiose symporter-like transporter